MLIISKKIKILAFIFALLIDLRLFSKCESEKTTITNFTDLPISLTIMYDSSCANVVDKMVAPFQGNVEFQSEDIHNIHPQCWFDVNCAIKSIELSFGKECTGSGDTQICFPTFGTVKLTRDNLPKSASFSLIYVEPDKKTQEPTIVIKVPTSTGLKAPVFSCTKNGCTKVK